MACRQQQLVGHPAIQFDLQLPLNPEIIAAQIKQAVSLGLPPPQMNHGGKLAVDLVASGPSAKNASWGRCSAAVNNALRLFGPEGPTYWIACDPQELVADFIPADPPKNTVYLLATKCHPKVFERLKDRNVQVWQIDDHEMTDGILAVPTAISVTLCAINLLAQMGYSTVHTYGWDGCYFDAELAPDEDYAIPFVGGESYASPQAENPTKVVINASWGKRYATTRSWACEAEDAINQFRRDAGHYRVKINGPGMIGDIVRHFGLAA